MTRNYQLIVNNPFLFIRPNICPQRYTYCFFRLEYLFNAFCLCNILSIMLKQLYFQLGKVATWVKKNAWTKLSEILI